MEMKSINSLSSIPINQPPAKKQVTEKTADIQGDSFKPSDDGERNFLDRAIDGIANFIKTNIVGTAENVAHVMKTDFGVAAMTTGGIIGGVTGAVIGSSSADLELGNTRTTTQTWQEPNTYNKHLGYTPNDYFSYYDRWGSGYHEGSSGTDPVYREAPVFNNDGSVKMHDVTKTFDSNRFGKFAGTALCGILGVAGGVLAGFGVSTIRKIIMNR